MAQILDGKELSKKVKDGVKVKVDKLKEKGINPLCKKQIKGLRKCRN